MPYSQRPAPFEAGWWIRQAGTRQRLIRQRWRANQLLSAYTAAMSSSRNGQATSNVRRHVGHQHSPVRLEDRRMPHADFFSDVSTTRAFEASRNVSMHGGPALLHRHSTHRLSQDLYVQVWRGANSDVS